jgi:hypothetical protein
MSSDRPDPCPPPEEPVPEVTRAFRDEADLGGESPCLAHLFEAPSD